MGPPKIGYVWGVQFCIYLKTIPLNYKWVLAMGQTICRALYFKTHALLCKRKELHSFTDLWWFYDRYKLDKQSSILSQCFSQFCYDRNSTTFGGVWLFLLSTCLQGAKYYSGPTIKAWTNPHNRPMKDYRKKWCLPWMLQHVIHRRNGAKHLEQQNKTLLFTAFWSDM